MATSASMAVGLGSSPPSLFFSAPLLQSCGRAAGPGLSAALVLTAQVKMRQTDPEKFKSVQRNRKTPALLFKRKLHHPPILPVSPHPSPLRGAWQGFVQGGAGRPEQVSVWLGSTACCWCLSLRWWLGGHGKAQWGLEIL